MRNAIELSVQFSLSIEIHSKQRFHSQHEICEPLERTTHQRKIRQVDKSGKRKTRTITVHMQFSGPKSTPNGWCAVK